MVADALQSGENWGSLAEKIDGWLELPPQDLPRAEVRDVLQRFQESLTMLKLAARRERCEWDLSFREEPYGGAPWPEVDWLAKLARVLALEIRYRLAERDREAALQGLQTGFSTARHLAEAPLVIHRLIAASIVGKMFDQLHGVLMLPASDNLYWSLTSLPHPLIDFQPALEFEQNAVYLLCPQLRGAATAERSERQWQADLDALLKTRQTMNRSEGDLKAFNAANLADAATAAADMSERAKAILRAEGWSAEKIARMSRPS